MTAASLAPERAAALAEFARACKTAARAVSLYPGTHPAITASLERVTAAASRLTGTNRVTLTVHPDTIVVDGQPLSKPDASIAELAELLHERLIGELTIGRAAPNDWHALLSLLGRAPEDVIAGGGIARAWAAIGCDHFTVREIDYAEVLRERGGGEGADWPQIIASCLQGDAPAGAKVAALIELLRRTIEAQGGPDRLGVEILQAIAEAMATFSPEMLLELLRYRRESPALSRVLADVATRVPDRAIAGFVAGSVVAERGATDRLAQAFEALVPDAGRKERLLQLAHDEAAATELGREASFEELWQNAASMLRSYSDANYVSAEYAGELSGAKAQAIDVERVSDDPPERVDAWLATVSDAAVRQLDLALLLDLLRLEQGGARWSGIADTAVSEIERLTTLGEVEGARHLAAAIATSPSHVERLASGPLVRRIVVHLRGVEDAGVAPLAALVQTIGAALVRPLAEALAAEEHSRAIRRLRELLIAFGAAGRQSVEQLKTSSNPAVRRTAIDLLRVFGGRDALPELASMLDDSDPQVQRESIRAIVQIGTTDAYAVLERALVAGSASRETVLEELIGIRDDKVTPLLCYVLGHTKPRGSLVTVHAQMIEALGGLTPTTDSIATLRAALLRGEWWAPARTAALRKVAATSLRRLGSTEAMAVLQNAATTGSRGVRNAARSELALASRRPAAASSGRERV